MLVAEDLFNEGYYLAKNPDIAAAIATGAISSAAEHFFTFGEVEGRDPSAFFDSRYYLETNPDVAAVVADFRFTALEHFIEFGQREGRSPTPFFDLTWYRDRNPDVAAAVDRDDLTGSFVHYVLNGAEEGRSPSPIYDESFYLNANPDIAAAVGRDELTGIEHFISFGSAEGRRASEVFDSRFYLDTYPDVALAVSNGAIDSPAEHFLRSGRFEGRLSVPNVALPEPTGPLNVGQVSYQFRDPGRPEIFTPDPNDSREVGLRVWYPVGTNAGNSTQPPGPPTLPPTQGNASYIRDAFISQAVAAAQGLNPNFYNEIETNSRSFPLGLATTAERYPVILFSHGLGVVPEFYTNYFEDLASHGYVVGAIDHSYVAGISRLSNGAIAPFASNFLPADPSQLEGALTQTLAETSQDVSFILDQLAGVNANDPQRLFTGKLDLERVGIFGHSLGGLTAIAALQRDPRLDAAVSLDPTVISPQLVGAIDRPLMVMNATSTFDFDNSPIGQLLGSADRQLRPGLFQQATGPAYNVTIDGTEHGDFSDLPLLFPLQALYSPDRLGQALGYDIGLTDIGRLDGDLLTAIVRDYNTSFFDRHLKGETEPLLAGVSLFPEVNFETRNSDLALRESVRNAVLQQARSELAVPDTNLGVFSITPTLWPDGCLGLAQPGEICTQAQVPGWSVLLSDPSQPPNQGLAYVYRTNFDGTEIRREPIWTPPPSASA
ncbi:hypothetical protein JJD41_13660 [Oxynema sp. CENA135]|uniref:alpha/beta hydrolase family protein n=1 Tax=Oxynema sp. CENA135 TaxID=984206 RepID=UPI00190D50C1|nr:hypothetical protein [Oxynema sp. CENA135]MBK4730899.1 hypothetical protein [Oxynema sp. CENA135]